MTKRKQSRPTKGKDYLPHQHLVHEQVELEGRQTAQLQQVVRRHQHSGRPEQAQLGRVVLLQRLVLAEDQEQQEPS